MKHKKSHKGDAEAPKLCTSYFQFYKVECKRLEGEKTMDNNERKALGLRWRQMSEDEKEPYKKMFEEQKQALAEWKASNVKDIVVPEEEKKEKSSRCSLIKLSEVFEEMRKMNIESVVHELGFGPLLEIKPRAIHRDLCRTLVENFDVQRSIMEFDGHKIPVLVEDVEAVLGLKNEGVEVEIGTRNVNAKEMASKYGIKRDAKVNELEEDIVSGKFEGDELKARVLLFIVGVFISPNANNMPSSEHLRLLCPEGLKGNLNWCKYAYNKLLDGVENWKVRGGLAYMTGCIAILEVRLFDFWSGVASRIVAVSQGRGRIHAWGNKKAVKKIVNSLKEESHPKRPKVLGYDDEKVEGEEGDQKNGTNHVVMDMLQTVLVELGGIKDSLQARLEKEKEIEESIRELKEECKSLNANMIELQKSYKVAIWSSRTRENLHWALWRISDLKPRLAFIWDQSHCEKHPSYPNVYTKNLRRVWDNMPQYNEGNTLLVDDSEAKMLNNPENNYICPKSYNPEDERTHNALEIGGSIRVYVQNMAAADNVQEYVKHHPFLD